MPPQPDARPAIESERLVYDHAALHLRSIGVNVPDFTVTVSDAQCGDGGPSVAVACAEEGQVFLTMQAAAEARRYYRSARHVKLSTRAKSLRRCGGDCVDPAHVAMHELVHLARFAVRPISSWVATDYPFEEGLAEAVAAEQVGPFMYRVAGLRGVDSGGYIYSGWVDMVYAATGGECCETERRARLNLIGVPSVLFSMERGLE